MSYENEIVQILCPFGEWPHPRGMQVVDEEAARRMKRSAAIRLLGGIPVYIGHPDDEPAPTRLRPVGKIKKICSTKDGIAVVAAYDDDAYEKLANGSAMSPRWQMEKIGGGKYRPVKLISAGITDNPNIPASGRILAANADFHSVQTAADGAQSALEKIRKLSAKLGDCSGRTARVAKEINALKIAKRIADSRPADAPEHTAPRGKALAQLAKERSKTLGEPYTKSFAALRKNSL